MKKNWLIIAGVVVVGIGVLIFFAKNRGSTSEPVKEAVTIKGSDTEVQLSSNLVEAFTRQNPGSDISVTGGGSGVGIAALLNQEIDLANSSRDMDAKELQQAKDKGLNVQKFILAVDGLSVITHAKNTLPKLSLEQIADIYKGKITNWKEVGGKDQEIVLYGRQSTSGTHTFFRNTVVKDDYSPKMLNMEGTEAIVQGVAADENGIGYAGVGYIKDQDGKVRNDIHVIPVTKDNSSDAVSPLDGEAVKRGDYPISRRIFQFLAKPPQKNSLLAKLLQFENSNEGQEIIARNGFYVLSEQDRQGNQKLLDGI